MCVRANCIRLYGTEFEAANQRLRFAGMKQSEKLLIINSTFVGLVGFRANDLLLILAMAD